jgi:hypothetical protein
VLELSLLSKKTDVSGEPGSTVRMMPEFVMVPFNHAFTRAVASTVM